MRKQCLALTGLVVVHLAAAGPASSQSPVPRRGRAFIRPTRPLRRPEEGPETVLGGLLLTRHAVR
jgi:hypothetical protein